MKRVNLETSRGATHPTLRLSREVRALGLLFGVGVLAMTTSCERRAKPRQVANELPREQAATRVLSAVPAAGSRLAATPQDASGRYAIGSLPSFERPLVEGEGRELIARHCVSCHSTTYITAQPLLSNAQWADVVDRMATLFGASFGPNGSDDASAQAKMVAYLSAHYGSGAAGL